ncbi:MAG: GNAT family N-acetyltransferase [Promethearchaeota archaeon]
MIKITRAVEEDLQGVFLLLKTVDLPKEGVTEHFHTFFVARDGDLIVGCIGIEIYSAPPDPSIGLLRSVAVHPSFQGKGIGHQLVEKIHEFSNQEDLKEVYLLTETAEHYFPKFGYVIIPREEADPKIKQSVEFTTLCIDSPLMKKSLV